MTDLSCEESKGAALPYQLQVKLKDGKVQAGPLQLPLRLAPLY